MSNRTQIWVWVAAATVAGSTVLLHADEPPTAGRPAVVAERFVPRLGTSVCGAGKIEIRPAATSSTNDITLRQLCSWTEADAAAFSSVANLVVDRFDGTDPIRVVKTETIKTVLRQAGVNLGNIQFSGSTQCLVSRGLAIDTTPAAPAVPAASTIAPDATAAKTQQPVVVAGGGKPDECTPFHSLKDRLMEDLSQRLNVPVDQLDVSFPAKDVNTLNMSEPVFHFEIEPRHVRDLGHEVWDVTVMTGTNREKTTITAEARAWENDLVLSRPVASGQLLTDEDFTDRKILIDTMPRDTILSRKQVLGQQASRAMSPGTVLTGRLIDPVQLARAGQLVTVTLTQGSVQVTTAAKAIEAGTIGQTIRVRNEETRDIYEVTLTGKQTAVIGGAAPGEGAAVASVRE